MLRQRLLTALVAMPVVVALAIFAPQWIVGVVFGVIVVGGGWEWAAFAGLDGTARAGYALVIAALVAGCGFALATPAIAHAVIVVGCGWWIIATVWLFNPDFKAPRMLIALCGVLALAPAWEAVIALRATAAGAEKLLFILVLIWAADSGAYAVGRLCGRRRLAPRISPGKTWEGVAGGLAAALAVGALGGWYFDYAPAVFLPLCILVAASSIIGDLTESLFKRLIGIKDSGNIFPGHGGVLDRLDSLSAAAPIFYLGVWALAKWL